MERYDVAVLGGGAAGMTVASGVLQFGQKAILLEKNALGGDCLFYGCVPTKTLVHSAKIMAQVQQGRKYGIDIERVEVNFNRVLERMREVVANIQTHDQPERFTKMGGEVSLGDVQFLDEHRLMIDERTIEAKKIVLATGARPFLPPIEGLSTVPFYTYETIGQMKRLPATMAILGAGPIGIEFAQIFARLTTKVIVIEANERLLPREDQEIVQVVRESLESEKITLNFSTKVKSVKQTQDKVTVVITKQDEEQTLTVDALLVATGRIPNVHVEGIQKIGLLDATGKLAVDPYLRTKLAHIFAAGDVKGGMQFTHVAGYDGKTVVRNLLFLGRQKADYRVVPAVTYTDPEVAHVGLTEEEVVKSGREYFTYKTHFADVDRAVIDGVTHGMVKVLVDMKGKLLGAHIVGSHAGELIAPLVFAMRYHHSLGDFSRVIHAYPTMMEGIVQTSHRYWQKILFDSPLPWWMQVVRRR